jgi:acyl CoA:acetate/3-ketoacid CoA transferase beta subunit
LVIGDLDVIEVNEAFAAIAVASAADGVTVDAARSATGAPPAFRSIRVAADA